MSLPRHPGPWTQRWLARLFTVLFGILSFWLLGFLIDDIGAWPGPDYRDLEESRLPAELVEQFDKLTAQQEAIRQDIQAGRERQALLRDSTQNAQTTMNQLLQFQQLSLEKGVTPTEQEQLALAESQQRFLLNQRRYQELSEEISGLEEQQRGTESELREVDRRREEARTPILEEFDRLSRRHDLWLAFVKLLVLTPLLILAVWLFVRYRDGVYMPMLAALGLAVGAQVILVMHEYFPSMYFKYVLIVTFLVVVTRALQLLLRGLAHPKKENLLKQFREAYESFLCPVCAFPIRRGPLKFLYWTRRTIKKLRIPAAAASEPEGPYSCPSCGTALYEECSACHQVRHSLLPTCEHCGTTAPPDAVALSAE